VSNLLAKAEAERKRREAAGISDSVEAAQQKEAPPFDTRLVGKRLEVCWPYKESGKVVKIWASGTAVRCAGIEILRQRCLCPRSSNPQNA